MKITYDPTKNARNIAKHGVSLDMADEMDLADAVIMVDDRFEYGEDRFCAFGMIGDRLHVLVFTVRCDVIRVISLRKANRREVSRYAKT